MVWRDIARSQDGVVSRAQLRGSGLSNRLIAEMARRGALDRPSQGIYLVGGAPFTYRAQLWAAVLSTAGILAFHTAAELWGMSERRDGPIHLLLHHDRRVVPPPEVQVHRRRSGTGRQVELQGLPITSRRSTVLDQLGALALTQGQRLADRAVQRGWLRPNDVEQRLRAHPKRPGNEKLRLIAATLGDGAAAESERSLHRILRAAGIQTWIPNYQVWAAGDLIAVVDVAVPQRRLAIEVDGMAYHVDVERFRRDRSRQNALVELGWTVLRFTWADVSERPGYVTGLVRRFL